MELTQNSHRDTTPDDNPYEPASLNDSNLRSRGTAQTPSKATGSSPSEVEAKPPATDGADIDAMPVVHFCRSFLDRLGQEPELPADERQSLMAKALGDLLGDMVLNDLALGEIAQSLYDADRESYEAWSNNQFKRGLVLAITTLGLSGRFASNIIAMCRPQLTHELEIDSGVETVMLDTALGSLYDYAVATAEVRRVTRSGEGRPLKVAAQHARIMSAAQPLLKTFQTTVDKLRKKNPIRSLNIQAAGGVAVQVNEAGPPRAARGKDEPILVAEMELPSADAGAPLEEAPEQTLEVA